MKNKFTERFAELLKASGKQQKEIAKLLDVSEAIVVYWKTGRSQPTAEQIVKIAELFEVSTDYLLGVADF